MKIYAIALPFFIFCISISAGIVCPGGRRKCDSDSTCCKLTSGQYGCCPLKNAVCCSDGVHCCPQGTKCNDKEGTCDGQLFWISPPKKTTKRLENHFHLEPSNNLCPDHKQRCTSMETCCKTASGYACCPYKDGVCCSDQLHCCPHGTACDVQRRQCVRSGDGQNDINRTLVKKFHWSAMKQEVNKTLTDDVVCPGGQAQCPSFNTCCKVSQTEWGCCPIQNAVCCSDMVHCCPPDTRCTATGCEKLL